MTTLEALDALDALDVVVSFDKGERAAELDAVRRAVLGRARRGRPVRIVEIPDARREEESPYSDAVASWHSGRAVALEQALLEQTTEGTTVGILVWGDPSLYDSTLRILDEITARGRVEVILRVIPAVSSLHVLTARHGIALHAVGGSVLITTGRRLRAGIPEGIDDIAVFLDAECSFTALRGAGWQIYWGAFLGMPDEELIAGALDDVAEQIAERRSALRAAHGWVFDAYVLRRR